MPSHPMGKKSNEPPHLLYELTSNLQVVNRSQTFQIGGHSYGNLECKVRHTNLPIGILKNRAKLMKAFSLKNHAIGGLN